MKSNQKELLDDIKTYFKLELKRDTLEIGIGESELEKNHGRIEKRKYYISYNKSVITNKEKWKTINAIGRIDVIRE